MKRFWEAVNKYGMVVIGLSTAGGGLVASALHFLGRGNEIVETTKLVVSITAVAITVLAFLAVVVEQIRFDILYPKGAPWSVRSQRLS